MKISKRDTNLLLMLLGILIFVGAYSGISKSLNTKALAVRSEISSLQPRQQQLPVYYDNLPNYQKGLKTSKTNVEAILSRYPNDVRTEDLIMFARKIEKKVGIDISSINFSTPAVIAQFDMLSSDENGEEFVPTAVMATSMSASCTLTYLQYKKLANFIRDEVDHTTLDNIDVSFNSETGNLMGNFTLTKYFVCGENYIYEPTDVPNVTTGTPNPFGTFSVSQSSESSSSNLETQQ